MFGYLVVLDVWFGVGWLACVSSVGYDMVALRSWLVVYLLFGLVLAVCALLRVWVGVVWVHGFDLIAFAGLGWWFYAGLYAYVGV